MSTKLQGDQAATVHPSRSPTGADVLIVVPTLNEADHIADVIAALQADCGCSDALIAVSDGGSSDQTPAIVQRIGTADPRVRMLTTVEHLSTSASINRAVES